MTHVSHPCPRCGYDLLHATASDTCPECGLASARAAIVDDHRERRVLGIVMIIVAMARITHLLAIVIGASVTMGRAGDVASAWVRAIASAIAVLAIVTCVRAAAFGRGRWVWAVIAVVLTLASSVSIALNATTGYGMVTAPGWWDAILQNGWGRWIVASMPAWSELSLLLAMLPIALWIRSRLAIAILAAGILAATPVVSQALGELMIGLLWTPTSRPFEPIVEALVSLGSRHRLSFRVAMGIALIAAACVLARTTLLPSTKKSPRRDGGDRDGGEGGEVGA